MALALGGVVVCTDAKSAFDSVLRSALWKATLDVCPRPAGVLQNLFGVEHTVMWAEDVSGAHGKICRCRGTGQGGPESMPLCCVMAGAQDRVLRA